MLLDEAFATEMLQTSWRDWTPQQAEAVRRHFLGPWFHKAHCRDIPLDGVLDWMTSIMTYGPEIQRLREAASDYVHLTGFTTFSET